MLYSLIWTVFLILEIIYFVKFSGKKGIKVKTDVKVDFSNLSEEEKESVIQEAFKNNFPRAMKKLRRKLLISALLAFSNGLISLILVFIEAFLHKPIMSIMCSLLIVLWIRRGVDDLNQRPDKSLSFDELEQAHSN